MEPATATCAACGGTGWVLDAVDGRKQARPCACRARRLREDRLAAAGIPERHRLCTIENFNDRTLDLKRAKDHARDFVDRYPIVEAGLLFIGPSGCGKTHLACAILLELISSKGVAGLYVDCSDLLNRIQTAFRPDAEGSREAVLSPLMRAELLVLDEIGGTPPHPWVLDVLHDLLNGRYNRKKITIVTTNFGDQPDPAFGVKDRLEDRIGSRTRSRLFEMCLTVPLRGEDYRKEVLSAQNQLKSRF